ncbi:MAG: SH3 domain-containing protein [Clostridia bacterium]|nr:SH3 domain-containing protein [Clostridia bacterium]
MKNRKKPRLLAAVILVMLLWVYFALPAEAKTVVKVTNGTVNVRSDAGTSYRKIGVVGQGKTFPYFRSKKASNGRVWYQIQLADGKKGWISSGYGKLVKIPDSTTTTAKPATTTTTTQSTAATTAENPSTTSAALTSTTVTTVTEETSTVYSSTTIAEKSSTTSTTATTEKTTDSATVTTTTVTTATTATTTVTEKPTTTTTTKIPTQKMVKILRTPLNVRANAGQSYTKLGQTSKGKTYVYLGSKKASNGKVWYQIQFTSKLKGWVVSSYAQIVEVPVTTQTTVSTTAPSTQKTTAATSPTKPKQDDGKRYIQRTITVKQKTSVHSAPGSNHAKMGTVVRGAKYIATDWQNDSHDITWYSFKLNGKTVWISRLKVSVSDIYTEIPSKNFQNGGTPMIYLSPSRQVHNAYAVRSTNEQEQMYRVAKELESILKKEYVCSVYTAPVSMPLESHGRAYDAYLRKADVYLAIHSNADPKVNSHHYGPMGFYFPGCAQSKRLAQNVVTELSKVTPRGSTVSPNVVNGMLAFDKTGYTDVRDPSNYGMVSILAEVEFHDKSSSAQWIMNHPKTIARALANALEKTFGLQKK